MRAPHFNGYKGSENRAKKQIFEQRMQKKCYFFMLSRKKIRPKVKFYLTYSCSTSLRKRLLPSAKALIIGGKSVAQTSFVTIVTNDSAFFSYFFPKGGKKYY